MIVASLRVADNSNNNLRYTRTHKCDNTHTDTLELCHCYRARNRKFCGMNIEMKSCHRYKYRTRTFFGAFSSLSPTLSIGNDKVWGPSPGWKLWIGLLGKTFTLNDHIDLPQPQSIWLNPGTLKALQQVRHRLTQSVCQSQCHKSDKLKEPWMPNGILNVSNQDIEKYLGNVIF